VTHRGPERARVRLWRLIAAAASVHAALITGDAHLLELEGSIPLLSPRTFLDSLDAHEWS